MTACYVTLLGLIRIISVSNPAQKRDESVGHTQWRNYLVTDRKQFDSGALPRRSPALCETDLSHWTLAPGRAGRRNTFPTSSAA